MFRSLICKAYNIHQLAVFYENNIAVNSLAKKKNIYCSELLPLLTNQLLDLYRHHMYVCKSYILINVIYK